MNESFLKGGNSGYISSKFKKFDEILCNLVDDSRSGMNQTHFGKRRMTDGTS